MIEVRNISKQFKVHQALHDVSKPLIRQEEAAIMYALLTQPTDQIVAELMAAQQPQAEPAEGAEPADETSETAPVPVPGYSSHPLYC